MRNQYVKYARRQAYRNDYTCDACWFKTRRHSNEFPERFFDVGIAEQHATTMAAGLATQNMKPFLAIYSTFLQRAYDQVLHDIARPKLECLYRY